MLNCIIAYHGFLCSRIFFICTSLVGRQTGSNCGCFQFDFYDWSYSLLAASILEFEDGIFKDSSPSGDGRTDLRLASACLK